MGHKDGAYLGAVKDIATLRERCYVDGDCWHLRSPRGRPMPKDSTHQVFLHGIGKRSATRAAWYLAHGSWPRKDRYVTRVCDSYDCVNPEHLKAYSRKEQGAFYIRSGRSKSAAKAVAAAATARKRSKLTPEQRELIINSRTGREAAIAVGIAESYAIELRRRHRELFFSMMKEAA